MVAKTPGLDDQHVEEAIAWLVKLKHSELSASRQRAFQQWLEASPRHQQAWQAVAEMEAGLGALPTPLAADALNRAEGARHQHRLRRRQFVKMLGFSGAALGAGWLGCRELPWQCWTAQYRTAIGGRRALSLDDGVRVLMNTDTALNIDESADLVRFELLQGEIQVDSTAVEGRGRQQLVHSIGGAITSCRSRFHVRAYQTRSCVFLEEGRLRLVSGRGYGEGRQGGESWWLSPGRVEPTTAASHDPRSWIQGVISARDMPLASLLGEMSRYRRGFISCADGVSDRRVSGSFQTADIDQALVFLARSQDLRLSWRSPYWAYLDAV